MDIGIFDNFEEDGQLTLFGIEEELEELQMSARERARKASGGQAAGDRVKEPLDSQAQKAAGSRVEGSLSGRTQKAADTQVQPAVWESDGVRIRRCASCGKLLFVREEAGGGYSSACNACGISYVQKV